MRAAAKHLNRSLDSVIANANAIASPSADPKQRPTGTPTRDVDPIDTMKNSLDSLGSTLNNIAQRERRKYLKPGQNPPQNAITGTQGGKAYYLVGSGERSPKATSTKEKKEKEPRTHAPKAPKSPAPTHRRVPNAAAQAFSRGAREYATAGR